MPGTAKQPRKLPLHSLILTCFGLGTVGCLSAAYLAMKPSAQVRQDRARAAFRQCVDHTILITAKMPEHRFEGQTVVFVNSRGRALARANTMRYDISGTAEAMSDPLFNDKLVRISGAVKRACKLEAARL